MARPKKQPKIKEPIRLRTKTLANGNKSLYLDMYHDGQREYLFLRLYLIPETDQAAKTANQNTLQAANAIKAQKIIEITNGKAGLSSASVRSKIKLLDWVEQYEQRMKERRPDSHYHLRMKSLKNHLKAYKPEVTLRNIDREYCEGLIDHLAQVETQYGGKMAPSTIECYLMLFNSAINAAVHEDIIPANPMTKIDPKKKPRGGNTMREYLTVEELKVLMDAPTSRKPDIKRAFLFCCFCGLRFSDVEALTWGSITKENGQSVARIIIKKTRQPLHVPLSPEALRWMPERGNAADTDKIFELGDYPTARQRLKVWIDAIGLKKHVTFHVARHTFATLMLTLGADLYTTSKLLGHSKVTTTQIYAKIVDVKKVEAVNLVNGIFGTPGKEGEQ